MSTLPQYFTPSEAAEILRTSTDSIRRFFRHVEGVMVLYRERKGHRRYETLRIPPGGIRPLPQPQQAVSRVAGMETGEVYPADPRLAGA